MPACEGGWGSEDGEPERQPDRASGMRLSIEANLGILAQNGTCRISLCYDERRKAFLPTASWSGLIRGQGGFRQLPVVRMAPDIFQEGLQMAYQGALVALQSWE